MTTKHLFPATQLPSFDNEHFNDLSGKRNHLDYKCYLFLCKILDDIPERYHPSALELINNRELACDAALHYVTTGVKPS